MDTNLATLVIFFLLIVLSVLIPTVFPGCQLSPRVRWDRQNGVALEAGFMYGNKIFLYRKYHFFIQVSEYIYPKQRDRFEIGMRYKNLPLGDTYDDGHRTFFLMISFFGAMN